MPTPADDELREALVGAWLLRSYESRPVQTSGDPAADVIHPLGTDPVGIILYTPDGYMSAQIMRADRASYSRPDPSLATVDELAGAAASYLSYSGPYTVAGRVVSHHVRTSLLPNWAGGVQHRTARLEADVLTLGPTEPTLVQGSLRNAELVWQRA